jgi:hypothetical protein
MASARVFEHNDFRGRSALIDNPGHQRFLLATFDFRDGLGFNDILSSLQLRSSTRAIPSSCILFEHTRFSGRIKAFAYNANRDVDELPDFNDVTSSVLLMDHDPRQARTVLHLRQLAGDRLNTAIDDELASSSDASRDGDVVVKFVIDLFEVSLFGTDLLLLEIPVRIHTPWPFSDYSAQIRYYMRLFINDVGQCRGFVTAWGYWIEGGILTGSIEGRLRQQIPDKIGSVETRLNNMLTELDFHRWNDVYLMPGSAAVTADYDSTLDEDCTIVLLRNPD